MLAHQGKLVVVGEAIVLASGDGLRTETTAASNRNNAPLSQVSMEVYAL